MKKITEHHLCDRCGKEIEYAGSIIEHLSYTHSGYDPLGDGGMSYKNLEFCRLCSLLFLKWRESPK